MKTNWSFGIWVMVTLIYFLQITQCTEMTEMRKTLKQIEVNTKK